eukprot:gnl/TRDRNA2_/TRDRNA2_156996_c1_seq1.p1 gnl/TRDRNA2_/TRDRNA2_156996_c1~~gnl/TRDRNA2_/TRDRNA2_156996_c1_seq1.p1  ORF type:complete len:338 (-),score=43.07 gnl/TRDRNA2_/TRDRNA2_156996_c1_seq1:225-1097(-)
MAVLAIDVDKNRIELELSGQDPGQGQEQPKENAEDGFGAQRTTGRERGDRRPRQRRGKTEQAGDQGATGRAPRGGRALEDLEVGELVSGVITNKLQNRVWVNIGAVKDASFLAWPGAPFEVGDQVTDMPIVDVQVDSKRIELQRQWPEGEPDEQQMGRSDRGGWGREADDEGKGKGKGGWRWEEREEGKGKGKGRREGKKGPNLLGLTQPGRGSTAYSGCMGTAGPLGTNAISSKAELLNTGSADLASIPAAVTIGFLIGSGVMFAVLHQSRVASSTCAESRSLSAHKGL